MTPEQKAQIHDGVMALDPYDDAKWTAAGLPDIDAVNDMLGLTGKAKLTRAMITEAAPDYARDHALARAAEDTSAGPRLKTRAEAADEIAEDPPVDDDPAMLMERFVALVQQDRYRRNRVFMQIAHLWQAEQEEARTIQSRLDDRHERRAERRQREKVSAFEEEHKKQLDAEKQAAAAAETAA